MMIPIIVIKLESNSDNYRCFGVCQWMSYKKMAEKSHNDKVTKIVSLCKFAS